MEAAHRSAMRISALAIAAGTILGLSAAASGQSRRVEVRPEGGKPDRIIRIERGDDDRKEERRIEVRVEDDEDSGPRTERRSQVRIEGDGDYYRPAQRERRVVVRRGDGERNEVCPECGHVKGNQGPQRRQIELRGMGGQGDVWRGQAGPHAEFFSVPNLGHTFQWRADGPDGAHGGNAPNQFRMRALPGAGGHGKAVIVGPDGRHQEFNLGDGGAGQSRGHITELHEGDGGEGDGPRVMIHRFGGEGQGGGHWEGHGDMQQLHEHLMQLHGQDGEHRIELRGVPGGDHADGGVRVEGKVVIVGPDGQTQEFDLGGKGAKGGKAAKGEKGAKRQRIEIKKHDGGHSAAHPEDGRVIEVRRVSRGGPV